MIFLYFFCFRLKYHLSSFSHKFRICDFFVFFVNLFLRQSTNFMNFVFEIPINRTTLSLIFVSHQVKNTCQCTLTIKVKLHSSIILPNTYQFVITFSTSQHKDRRPISKVICSLVMSWWIQIRVCTPLPYKNTNCLYEWIFYRDIIY